DRHEYAGDVADPPDAPEDDQAGEYHKEDPCNPAGYKEAVVHDIGDRIGLDTVADAERCECREEGEQHRQPFELPSDALFSVVHRAAGILRSEEHTSELQSRFDLVCRLLLEKKNKTQYNIYTND